MGPRRGRLLVLTALLAARVAAAQTPEEALLQRGVELRSQGRDDEALQLFQRAFQVARSPRALAQVGLAEQALGRWVDAERHLREALAAAGDPWISARRQALEGSFAVVLRHVGSLDVRGGVAGAEVLVDGERVAVLPMATPARVVAGTHAVEVRAPGHTAVTRTVSVPPGGLARETFRLARVPSLAPTPRDPPRGSAHRALAWTTGAGAALFLGGGAVFAVLRERTVLSYNEDVDNRHCYGVNYPGTEPQDCRDARAAAETYRSLAIAGLAVGGALALTSTVLFLTAPSPRRAAPRRAAGLPCGPGPGLVGVVCGGTF